MDATPVYIDVRSPGEFAAGHLDGALNLPLDQLPARLSELEPLRGRELVLHCASGARSAYACALLQAEGHVVRNGGGVGALALQCGRPVRHG